MEAVALDVAEAGAVVVLVDLAAEILVLCIGLAFAINRSVNGVIEGFLAIMALNVLGKRAV